MNRSSKPHSSFWKGLALICIILGMLGSTLLVPTTTSAAQTVTCNDGSSSGIGGYTSTSECAQYLQINDCIHSDAPTGPIDTLTCNGTITPPPKGTPTPPACKNITLNVQPKLYAVSFPAGTRHRIEQINFQQSICVDSSGRITEWKSPQISASNVFFYLNDRGFTNPAPPSASDFPTSVTRYGYNTGQRLAASINPLPDYVTLGEFTVLMRFNISVVRGGSNPQACVDTILQSAPGLRLPYLEDNYSCSG